jgi:hypothetical protein
MWRGPGWSARMVGKGVVHMDRTQFVDVANQGWWMLEPNLESAVEVKRQELGSSFDWPGDALWYTDPQKLEEILRFMDASGSNLLTTLDGVQDDYARQQWVDDLIAEKKAADTAAQAQSAGTGREEEQIEAPEAEATPEPQAPKKAGLFAKKPAAVSEPAAEEQAAPIAGASFDQINEQVQNVMSAMSDDQLAALADKTGLSVDQVRKIVADPSFASAVAAAQ